MDWRGGGNFDPFSRFPVFPSCLFVIPRRFLDDPWFFLAFYFILFLHSFLAKTLSICPLFGFSSASFAHIPHIRLARSTTRNSFCLAYRRFILLKIGPANVAPAFLILDN